VLHLMVLSPAAAFTTTFATPHHREDRAGARGYPPIAKRRARPGSICTSWQPLPRRRSWTAVSSGGVVVAATGNGSDEKDDEQRDVLGGAEGRGVDDEIRATAANDQVVEEEFDRLQGQMHYIEALEIRNEAQLGSFVDREDQWNSMEEDERELLESKDSILLRMEYLREE